MKILVVDDEQIYRDEITEFLSGIDCHVYQTGLPSKALETLKETDIDIIILDIKLPEMNGLILLKKIKKDYPDIEVIMITGHGDMDNVIKTLRLGAIDFINKPFGTIEIQSALERSKRFIDLKSKLKRIELNYSVAKKELQNTFGHEIIGNSQEMKRVFDLMSRVSKTNDTSVLITGETGTGKELVARGIHYLSERKNNYFYDVNCSAIPDTLFESEFFGHRKGAFTGAREEKAGCFEIANNGTLFLDEIGDMPYNQQKKLLRILEERKVRRIGSHKEIKVNVRLMAASNRDLKKLVDNNKFRADLYHRISTFTIPIQPLRNRKGDIPLLLEYFTKKFAEKTRKHITQIDRNVGIYLHNYDFPGNVREFKNMVEKAVIMCDENILRKNHFLDIKDYGSISEPTTFNLELLEKNTIIKALKQSGLKSDAAKLLNITHQSLNRKIKKHKINQI